LSNIPLPNVLKGKHKTFKISAKGINHLDIFGGGLNRLMQFELENFADILYANNVCFCC
jgi:hypothetical protein